MISSGQCSCWRHKHAKIIGEMFHNLEKKTRNVLLLKMVWNRFCVKFHSLLRPLDDDEL